VADVEPGSEDTLRHLLEATVQQVNADLEARQPDEDAGAEEPSADREMEDTFKGFARDSGSDGDK
jgi:hypothetical protein